MKLNQIMSEEKTIAGVNIVPVIDLCLVLLIILMVTSPILEQPELPVNLPRAATIETKEKNLSVTFSADGRIAVNTDVMIDMRQFDNKFRQEMKKDPETLVILRVDKGSEFGTLTDLWERCKKLGAQRIAIGTEQTKAQ